MRKIIFINDEKQTEYKDIPANVFDAVENLMDTYSDIYKDINRDKIRKPNCSEIPTGSTTKNDLGVREFVEIVVEYPPEDLCTYPEYKGKPYFSIKYEEGNDCIIGYGTYNPQVLSRYLKDYFMPTTKNDLGVDCISKIEVIDYLCKHCPDDGECFKDCDEIKHLRQMPSVTPQEPKTGHWIPTYGNVKCSVCGSVKDSREVGRATHYCDFCGAKMVEPQESEDKE